MFNQKSMLINNEGKDLLHPLFKTWSMTLEKIALFQKYVFFPSMTSLEKIALFQKHAFFPSMTSLEKIALFSKIRVFPIDDVIGENRTFSKIRVLSKTRTFHKYILKLLLHFISYCFSRHCLSLCVTRCLWKTIKNILMGG